MRLILHLIFISTFYLSLGFSLRNPRSADSLLTKDVKSHCKCGNRNTPVENRVVGGVNASRNEIPWRCYIRRIDGVFCGCSILNKKWVLTAAHCISFLFNLWPLYLTIRVYAGDHDISSDEDKYVQKSHVGQLYLHEEFNLLTMANDIALIKVTKPFRLNKYVSPICLPYNYDYDVRHRQVLISGWGATQEHGKQSNILQMAEVNLIPLEKCQELYGNKVNENNVCTLDNGKDTCQGDSGGSIDWAEDPSDCYTGIGIVSWGDGCAQENKPGVYTKLGNYLDWIKATTKG